VISGSSGIFGSSVVPADPGVSVDHGNSAEPDCSVVPGE